MPQWISDVIAVAPWLGAFFVALFAGVRVWRGVAPVFREVRNFLDDWKGTSARPGVPARAGVMERLDQMHHELHPNSGTSLADAVNRTEQKLDAHIATCAPPQTTINVNPAGGVS